MKNKIIAIVVTIVFIAGAGTAIGVTVDRQHNEETASLVNEAVSKALETTTTTTTATSTTTTAATTTTTAPAATKKTTTTTEAQTITNTTYKKYETIANKQANHGQYADSLDDVNSDNNQQNNAVNVDPPKHAVGEIIKDPDGDYFATNLLTHDENKFPVYVDCTSNLFYFKNNITGSYRIYVDKSEYN